MDVAIIADDLTGAADTGVQLAQAGYRTAVTFRDSPMPPAEDLDAVAVVTGQGREFRNMAEYTLPTHSHASYAS